MCVQPPGPMAWEIGAKTYQGPNGPQKVIVLRIEHERGSFVGEFLPENIREIAEGIMQNVTGIAVPRPNVPGLFVPPGARG